MHSCCKSSKSIRNEAPHPKSSIDSQMVNEPGSSRSPKFSLTLDLPLYVILRIHKLCRMILNVSIPININ